MQAALDRKIYKGIVKEREGRGGHEVKKRAEKNRADIFKRWQTEDKRMAGSDVTNEKSLTACPNLPFFLLPTPANNAAASGALSAIWLVSAGCESRMVLLTDMKRVCVFATLNC